MILRLVVPMVIAILVLFVLQALFPNLGVWRIGIAMAVYLLFQAILRGRGEGS